MHRCPWAYCGDDALAACDALGFAEVGILPEAGGMMDQPATFLDAMALAGDERARYLQAERERAQRTDTQRRARRRRS